MIFNEELKRRRKRARLSMAQAAKLCCVDKSTYWRWEAGETNMPGCAQELFEIKLKKIMEGLDDERKERKNRINEKNDGEHFNEGLSHTETGTGNKNEQPS